MVCLTPRVIADMNGAPEARIECEREDAPWPPIIKERSRIRTN
jgi:hypothetical protein